MKRKLKEMEEEAARLREQQVSAGHASLLFQQAEATIFTQLSTYMLAWLVCTIAGASACDHPGCLPYGKAQLMNLCMFLFWQSDACLHSYRMYGQKHSPTKPCHMLL